MPPSATDGARPRPRSCRNPSTRGVSPRKFARCSDRQARDNRRGMPPLVLAVVLWAAAGLASNLAQSPAADPDRLYADREHIQSALESAAIWEARLKKDPKDFESAWKLARSCYWLGGHVAEDQRRAQYERGIEA